MTKTEEKLELWVERCRLVKERIHSNEIRRQVKRDAARADLWVQICTIDQRLERLGVVR